MRKKLKTAEQLKNEKEHFFNIMKNIKVGSIIVYTKKYSDENRLDEKQLTTEVLKIIPCNNGYHEGCNHCVGSLYIDDKGESGCFKHSSTWELRIDKVINGFIEEDEFTI